MIMFLNGHIIFKYYISSLHFNVLLFLKHPCFKFFKMAGISLKSCDQKSVIWLTSTKYLTRLEPKNSQIMIFL